MALVLASVLAGTAWRSCGRDAGTPRAGGPPAAPAPLRSLRLDPAAWVPTSWGDFREASARIVPAAAATAPGRLCLRADTRDTDDRTVKFIGMRSREAVRLLPGAALRVSLDWNAQANGSYLSAGVVLSPHAAADNPLHADDWLRIEYVGVPPGANARLTVAMRTAGRERTLFADGWPESNRGGRPIGRQRLEIMVRGDGFDVRENEATVFRSPAGTPLFGEAYVHLQMSSHSNYPAREVYFDDAELTMAEDARRRGN